MRALLVDDHALFCEGVRLLVQHRLPQFELAVVHELGTALQYLRDEPGCRLVLLDLGLPDSDGLQGLLRLREAEPDVTVVVLSSEERRDTVLAAIDHGAAGFIPKTADSAVFCDALATVLDGRVYLPAQALAERPAPPAGAAAQLGLTPRQLEVLRLVVQGRSNKLIQRELGLSESTVKTHLEQIFRRLEVGSRTQAVVAAAPLGLRPGN